MSDYSKSFLLEDGRKREPGAKIWLGAFGKHPGWNDHVEDLGLETQSLILAKMILYVQGIGGQIDSGAWEKLDAAQQMAGFNHVFLWRRGPQFLLGKMWSSSDGKGRTRYPMILCLQCAGAPLGWAVRNIGPQLDEIQKKCVATSSADEVKGILARATADLRNWVSSLSPDTQGAELSLAERKAFVDAPSLGPDRQGLSRVVHQINSQMSSYSREAGPSKSSELRPQQIRLPRGVDAVTESLLLWEQVFQIMLQPGAPVLLVASTEQPWVDATVGEPTTHEFLCLRASDKNIPPASAIPYNLDETTKRRTQQIVDTLLSDSSKKPPEEPPGPKGGPIGGLTSFFSKARAKWLVIVVGLCVLLGIAGVVLETGHHGQPTPAADQSVQAKADATAKAREEARLEAEKEKLAAEAKVKTDTEVKSNQEAQAGAEHDRLAAEARAKADADAKAAEEARLVADARAKADAQTKAAEETRLKIEQDQLAAQTRAKADADARVAEDALVKAQQEQLLAQANAKADQEKLALVAKPVESTPIKSVPPPTVSINLDNSAGIKFVWVTGLPGVKGPAGVGAYEITEAQYTDVMQINPSRVKFGANFPVDSVSGFDAANFCVKLTEREHARRTLETNWKYALPTEEQWKYFAAGTAVGDSVTSKGRAVSRARPEPVGEMKANPFGLYDVIGNVWEWCQAADGKMIPKGGGYEGRFTNGIMANLSLDARGRIEQSESSPNVGFRIIVVPDSL